MPIFAAGGGCIDPYYREHMRVTQDTLNDLGAGDIPMLIVYNKADRLPQFASRSSDRYRKPYPYGSRCRPWHGCPCRLDLIQPLWQACDHGTFDPLQPGFACAQNLEAGEVAKTEYQNDGTYMQVTFTPSAKDHALMQEVASYRIG